LVNNPVSFVAITIRLASSKLKVNGAVPPVASTVIVPSFAPKQVILVDVCELIAKSAGSTIVRLIPITEQPLASKTAGI